MRIEIDHPKLRNSEECPTCHGHKDKNLVTCWPCYRKYGLRYGNAEIEKIIDKVEIEIS